MRCVLISFLALTVAASAAAEGYVVILKNGHRIRASEPLQIQGEQALITLVSQTMTSIPVDQVDLVATERYNQLGLGDALTIDELDVLAPTPTPTPPAKPNLGSIASIEAGSRAILGTSVTPSPTVTPGIMLQPFAYTNQYVEDAIYQIFDQRHLYLQFRTSAGTRPNFLFLQVVTNSQREVFEALEVTCEAYSIIHRLKPEVAPGALELEMITSVGKPAGTFRIFPDQAHELTKGEINAAQFYVKNVIF